PSTGKTRLRLCGSSATADVAIVHSRHLAVRAGPPVRQGRDKELVRTTRKQAAEGPVSPESRRTCPETLGSGPCSGSRFDRLQLGPFLLPRPGAAAARPHGTTAPTPVATTYQAGNSTGCVGWPVSPLWPCQISTLARDLVIGGRSA